MRTRAEHIAWMKEHAKRERGAQNKVASVMSDMGKHPETRAQRDAICELGVDLLVKGATEDEVDRWIDGIN